MTIYAKTNAGRLLAFDNSQNMPTELRNLLRRVDGKTQQRELLTTPGDAYWLQELTARELVQIVSTPWRNSAYASSQPDSAAPHKPQFDAAEPAGLGNGLTSSDVKIAPAKALMSDFVSAYVPEFAHATLLEIEALKSKADLLCMLSGYIDLVQRTGKRGQQHVQQLLLAVASSD